MSTFALVVTREPGPLDSAARLGRLTGQAVEWVRAAWRWGLLRGTGVAGDATAVRSCLLIAARDAGVAARLAAAYPLPNGYAISVLELGDG